MSAAHVLIVDDDAALLQALPATIQLRMPGARVDTADSAQHALQCIAETDYDAIVSDIKMPGMDGIALLREIQARRPHIPTLLITGHGEHHLAIEALRGGAYDFIQKPIDRTYFIASLNRAIQMRQLTRQVEAQRAALEHHADDLERTVEARTRELVRANQAKDELLADRDRALAATRTAQQRLAFLAEASTVLSTTLDYETTLQNIAQLAVPMLADWCFVDLFESDGSFRRLAVAHADPALAPLARRFQRQYAPVHHLEFGVSSVAGSGQAELYNDIPEAALTALARDGEHLAALQEMQPRSYMGVPLQARGHALGAISFAITTSNRRYGPDDLLLAEELSRRAALAVDNARLYREAQEAIQAREEFLSIASHELKTPLTAIQLQVDSLLLYADDGRLVKLAPAQSRRKIETLARQITRLTKLVNELLDISRIINGRIVLEYEPGELGSLVRDTIARFGDELALGGCTLELYEHGPIHGRFDRLRTDQIVTNLLSNAIKYGPGKPIEMHITADAATAQIVVTDHGIGIAPEHQERIFARFERAVSTRNYGGLGLGLYIVRQVLDALGGTISVRSELGVGATFTVTLPRTPPDP